MMATIGGTLCILSEICPNGDVTGWVGPNCPDKKYPHHIMIGRKHSSK